MDWMKPDVEKREQAGAFARRVCEGSDGKHNWNERRDEAGGGLPWHFSSAVILYAWGSSAGSE